MSVVCGPDRGRLPLTPGAGGNWVRVPAAPALVPRAPRIGKTRTNRGSADPCSRVSRIVFGRIVAGPARPDKSSAFAELWDAQRHRSALAVRGFADREQGESRFQCALREIGVPLQRL